MVETGSGTIGVSDVVPGIWQVLQNYLLVE